jgi:hypothetical protein
MWYIGATLFILGIFTFGFIKAVKWMETQNQHRDENYEHLGEEIDREN